MAVITPSTLSHSTGIAESYVAAASGGDTITNTGANPVFLVVKNSAGADIAVIVNATRPCEFGFDHDWQQVVPAGAVRTIGPLSAAEYGTAVAVTYSAVISVTVYAYTYA
jgi:predicted flavoprotein YhiN